MPSIEAPNSDCWIIGYGNSHRQDDGIGPYVVDRLDKAVKHIKKIRTVTLHQLEPELIEDLQHANIIIFIDATQDVIDNGLEWINVKPEFRGTFHVTHHFNPSFLLGLIHSFYQTYPETWLVTIQGTNFDFGENLTFRAKKRACRATSEILDFLDRHYCQTESIFNHNTVGG